MPSESPAALDPKPADLRARIAAVECTIAERDEELRAVRGCEAMFRSIVESLDRIFWIATADQSRMVYLSPATERILGRSCASVYADPRSWIAAIHPDDRERVLAAITARLSGQIPDPRYVIFRVVRPDGTIRWLRSSGAVISIPQGGPWYVGTAEDVTELKLDADTESEREAQLRLMTEQLPAVIWTAGPDLRFESGGGRGLTTLGVVTDEIRGMRIQDYFGTEDPVSSTAAHRRALAGEAVAYGLDWAGRTFDAHVEPLRDATGRTIGVLGLALDVTGRKQAEAEAQRAHEKLQSAYADLSQAHGELRRALEGLEERVRERTAALNLANEQLQREVAERLRAEESLQRSMDLYRLLAENSTDGIARFDVSGRYRYASPAHRSIIGYEPEDLVGQTSYGLVHPDDIEIVARAHQEVLVGAGRTTVSFRMRHKAGGYRWFEVSAKRIAATDGGAIREIVTVIRDVSERKEAAERLTRLQDELAHVARVSSLGEMASGLAHELNQPLTAVINYLEASRRLLSESKVAPEVTAAINEAAAEAQRAGRIIQRLRAFVRRGETERTVADVNRLVAEVMELAAADLRARRVKVELELGPDLPGVKADAVQVQQVMLNLLWNAVEAMTNEGRGERRITIRTVRSGEREVEVGVSDTGPGLAPEVRERLFEPFYTTKESGLGLGLPISYSIVEAHGGRLWADPETAAGTTFRFTLPVAVVPAGA